MHAVILSTRDPVRHFWTGGSSANRSYVIGRIASAALRALGFQHDALLTPYARPINGYIEARGVHFTRMASFDHANDNEVARIDTDSLQAAVERRGQNPDVEAVFVSCRSLRIAELVPELEARICKPVIPSNFGMAWHALRLGGEDREPQCGRFLEL